MTETLSPEQTAAFRAAQKKRAWIIMLLILLWIGGIFAVTLVKGHLAVAERQAKQPAQQQKQNAE
jgi:hypothetical protein